MMPGPRAPGGPDGFDDIGGAAAGAARVGWPARWNGAGQGVVHAPAAGRESRRHGQPSGIWSHATGRSSLLAVVSGWGASLLSVNMGLLGLAAVFVVGSLQAGWPVKGMPPAFPPTS